MAIKVKREFAWKFRMFPSPEQEAELIKRLLLSKDVWNMFLEQRNSVSEDHRSIPDIYHEWERDKKAGRKRNHRQIKHDANGKAIIHPSWVGRLPTKKTQLLEVKSLRDVYPELGAITYDIPKYEVAHLDHAFQRFFDPKIDSGYPNHKKVADSCTIRNGSVLASNPDGSRRVAASKKFGGKNYHALIYLGKDVGNVPFAEPREIKGSWGDVTISRRANGEWYFSVTTNHVKNKVSYAKKGSEFGMDAGVAGYRSGDDVNLLVFSDGRSFPPPVKTLIKSSPHYQVLTSLIKNVKDIRELSKRKDYEQKKLSKKVYGSIKYMSLKAKIANIYARRANLLDNLIKQTTALLVYTKEWGAMTIFMEDLKGIVKKGAGKKKVNDAMTALAIGRLLETIKKELERTGGTCARVDPAYSSRECSRCGHEEKANRKGRDKFKCKACGYEAIPKFEGTPPADYNAAINIHNRGRVSLNQLPAKAA